MDESGMKNVHLEIGPDGYLIIRCKLDGNFGRSKSGKSTIVATTSGIVGVPGTNLKMGLNLFR